MSPTGSTSEQKSPTKWQVRLGLALVVGLLLMMATTASAGWTTRSAPGTPNDVRVWAPGVFSVATDAGAWLERADGTTVFISTTSDAVGSFHIPGTSCFVAFQRNGSEKGIVPCDRDSTIELTDALRGVRSNETGAGFALLEPRDNRGVTMVFSSTAPGTNLWSPLAPDIPGPPSKALGVLRMGGSEDVLFGIRRFQQANDHRLYWYRDGVRMAEYGFPEAGGPPVVRDSEVIDLFPAGGSAPTALYSWGNSLYRGTLGGGGSPFMAVSYPGGEGTVTALDVNTGAGTRYGDGFGMATVQRDGGVTLLSAVPAARPEDIGTQWRVNTNQPDGGLTAPRSLACYGASFCVIAQATPTQDNVVVYTNDAPPTLTVESGSPDPFTLPSGTSRTINVRASDEDGDAVLVKVEPSSFSLNGVSMTTAAVDGGVDLVLDAGTVCAAIRQPITISATDGLDSHAMVGNYLLQVQRAAAPEAPTISPSANIAVPAGSESQTLTATSIAPCGVSEFTWTPVSPDIGRLVVSGAQRQQAVFTPPATVCNPLGETHLYRVRALEDGGVSSPPTDVTIRVLPWGPPYAPFDGGLSVTLQAGDSVTGSAELRPTATHACDDPGNDFPGVDTVWQLAGGGVAPPGVRLRAGRGGPIIGSSAVTPVLYIETDQCTHTAFNLTAQHYTRGGFGDGGPESNILVTVEKNWNPFSEATLELSSLPATPRSVVGSANVEGRCLEDWRELGLQARIFLTNDGGIVREGIFDVPGSWQFTLGDACLGATYELQGELLVDGGVGGGALPGGAQGLRGPFAVVTGEPITVPSVERAMLQPMAAPALLARCGQPAVGVLEQRALHPCSELPISWTQVGGIALTQPTYTGQRIEVATQDADFGELIGQSVVMRMSATAAQETELVQEVPILTEPFVELHRHTEKATGADVDLVGVSVELRNTTECGVRQVDHLERLEGVDYVPGSARFNGSPVEAEVEGDTLTVRGLVLEGSSTGRLTYVVRPRLLASSRFEGQAFVRGVPVSRPLEDPSAGCGCSGAGSGLAALGLAVLAVVLRRRRGR